ncbi:transporter [Flavobacterium sp. MAH-1]|uniref:Transporter n=1 Tax=Flavobacterium agri TaxID=2743471 RepID=A0A7Y9C3P9_9FLAO|nr:transporter [Flavobacterium agri]NUY79307.1 transporter [Flavobacterium agri]NYA69331.1 transporter [Flavobacterium agri]
MPKLKSLFSAAAICCSTFVSAQFTDVINSNRPGESMAAFSVGKTILQGELGFTGVKEDHSLLGWDSKGLQSDLVVRYGAFFEQLEFIGELQYQYDKYNYPDVGIEDETRSGFKTAYLGAKYLVYDPNKNYVDRKPNLYSWKANHKFKWRNLIPAVGVYAGVNLHLSDKFPPTDQRTASLKGMLITQNQLGRYVLVSNIYMDKFGSNYETLGYVVTLTRGINDRWSAFVENQGFQSDYYGDLIFRAGGAYLLETNLQLDVNFGVNVKDTPSVLQAGLGVSWRFDGLYEDVILRLPGEEKEMSKEDKKKKKEKDKKDKKRKDAIENETPEQP